jgi:hypothetical protein
MIGDVYVDHSDDRPVLSRLSLRIRILRSLQKRLRSIHPKL